MRGSFDDDGGEEASPYDDGPAENEITRPHGVRFGEGQKRGPGRPRGSPNRVTIIKRVANKRHKMRKNGKQRRMSTLELVLEIVRTQALQGNLRAFELQEKLVARYTEQAQPRHITVFPGGSKLTTEEWVAVFGSPRSPEDEVSKRFPQLKYVIKNRGRDPGESVLA